MANYLKATDFAAKDALLSGDPNKIVKGTEINDEFNAIQTAVNSKANVASPALTGVPTAPTASTGTNTTQLATTAFVQTEVIAATGSLGTMSTQNANAVAITGGSITGLSTALPIASGGTGLTSIGADGTVLSSNGTVASWTIPAATGLGEGQTWQNVIGSRALGTSYTNTTGRAIFVSACVYYGYDGTQVGAVVDGVTLSSMRVYSGGGVAVSMDMVVSFVVPAGSTYVVNGGSIRYWAELR